MIPSEARTLDPEQSPNSEARKNETVAFAHSVDQRCVETNTGVQERLESQSSGGQFGDGRC